jgi:steroid delta-isomerase
LKFYTESMATGAKLVLEGPIRVAAAHAAFAMQVRLHWDGKDMAIDVIDTFAFDETGKVKQMQAYFGPGNMHG